MRLTLGGENCYGPQSSPTVAPAAGASSVRPPACPARHEDHVRF